MRCIRREKLLTRLRRDTRVQRLDNRIAKRDPLLLRDIPKLRGQQMVFDLAVFGPGCEPAGFAEVAVWFLSFDDP